MIRSFRRAGRKWFLATSIVGCLAGAAVSPAFSQVSSQVSSQASAIGEEMWIRRTARELSQGAEFVGFDSREVATDGRPGWVGELAELEALARAGRTADLATAAERADERVELAAARLRVVPASSPEFEERLARGLRSSFAALRAATFDRLALWTLEASALDGGAHGFLARELSAEGLLPELADGLFGLALRSAGGRRLDVLLALPVATQALNRVDRSGWDPALGFLEDVIGVPITLEELARLRALGADPGALGLIELVARVRDGLAVSDPSISDIVAVIRSGASWPGDPAVDPGNPASAPDSGELDAVIEAFVDALVLDARHLSNGTVRALGEALVSSILAGAGADDDAEAAPRDRCVRTAARLLPMARQLDLGLGYGEDAAQELWYALDRAERWRGGPELAAALRRWLDHPSTEVRDAVVRAIGQRYAYGERDDFEPLLEEVLVDPDPTLRSLSYAWLIKSERRTAPDDALGSVLRAAWDAEGHGGEGPALTERQARWLAQFPRERTAYPYRDALLGLLALSGASSEVVGAGNLELLGGFAGDAEVFARVSLLAERSLVGLEAARDHAARLSFDSAAARALRILHRVDPDAAEPLVDGALRRSMDLMHGADAPEDARPQLPKTAAGLLGLTAGGRQRLASYLGNKVPRRVRFEAALQLLKRSDGTEELGGSGVFEACARQLMIDYGGVDGALRLRALNALGQDVLGALPSVEPFLSARTVAGVDQAERTTAIDVLGRRRHLGSLEAVMDAAIEAAGPDAGTIDAAAFAARALRLSAGRSSGIAALELGTRKLRRIDERPRATRLETVRGALLEALAELLVAGVDPLTLGEEGAGELMARFLHGPVRSVEEAARRGFGRERRIEASFLWASELAALKVLGRDRSLFRAAIGPEVRWGRLDGRLLLALAHVAAKAGDDGMARELSGASAIALQGEGMAQDHERRLAEARWLHAVLGIRRPWSSGAARSLRAFLASYRKDDLGRGVMRAMLPSIRRPVASAHARYWTACAEDSRAQREAAQAAAWSRLE